MVELGGKSPHAQSFDNSVFIIPAIVVIAIFAFAVYKLRDTTIAKEEKLRAARQRREEKKKAK